MILENALYAEIDRLQRANEIANNTITLMAKEVKLLKQRQIVVTSIVKENEAMEGEIKRLKAEMQRREDYIDGCLV